MKLCLILIILFLFICAIVGYFFDKKTPDTNYLKVKINDYGKSITNLIMLCSVILFFISLFYIYSWTKSSDAINNDIKLVQTKALKKAIIIDDNSSDSLDDDIKIISDYEKYTNSTDLNVDFDYLTGVNNDVVGWLKVNNTRINYPVVKYTDNDYYLKRSFSKEKNKNGWIYMDFRNKSITENKNTVIFGHNLFNGTMFGTLKKVLDQEWINNESNRIITYVTPDYYTEWKIFSVYVIDPVTDYLKISFKEGEFLPFIDMIKERSIYSFEELFTETDQIMTFSTCNNLQRTVVHSKLVRIIEK